MTILKRILVLLCSLALLTAALCGCGGGKSKPADSLTVGIAQDLDDSLDPHKMTAAGTREILFNVFEGLVKPDPDGDLIPAVASDYSISGTGDTFTFTLREGVRFHNGSTVTVGDIVYSISRAAGLETGEPLIAAFSAVQSVEAADERTVVIKTAEPYLEFLSYLTAAIIPEGSDPAEGLIGTGPFKYVSRAAQENIVLTRFDDYWGEKAHIADITFKVIENTDMLIMSLKSGAVDLCAHLTPTQVAGLGDGFTLLEGSMNIVQAMYLNNSYEPLQNYKARQALCYAVDKQKVLDLMANGKGSLLGSSMYPAFGKYYEDLSNAYPCDLEKARSLLAEAGYPDGFDLVITVPSNYQIHVDTAQIIAEQLKAVNVNCTIDTVEWSTWLEKVYQNRDYQATVVGFDTSAAMTAQSLLARFESSSKKNVCNFVSESFDAIYGEAITAVDEAVQIDCYRQCQRLLSDGAAAVYIQDPCDMVAMRKGVSGYVFYPVFVMDLSRISMEG